MAELFGIMKALWLLVLVTALGFCGTVGAVFLYSAMPSPPKAEIAEIIFERSDTQRYITMPREDFLRYFSHGVFHNENGACELVYQSGRFPRPESEKGEWIHCRGAFATKKGRVFFWTRPRLGVIEIEDSQHRTGWLIFEDRVKTAQPDAPAKAAEPPR